MNKKTYQNPETKQIVTVNSFRRAHELMAQGWIPVEAKVTTKPEAKNAKTN